MRNGANEPKYSHTRWSAHAHAHALTHASYIVLENAIATYAIQLQASVESVVRGDKYGLGKKT